MQSFPVSAIPSAGPKNYVFVDEHNRHKRLKVMRACEGCRRRKIRCDAATTNSWPCAACKRLKLNCVPPVGGVDGDLSLDLNDPGDDQFVSHQSTPPVQHYPPDQYQYLQTYSSQAESSHNIPYDPSVSQHIYPTPDFHYSLAHEAPNQMTAPIHPIYSEQRFASFDSTNGTLEPTLIGSPYSAESITAEDLAENLGDLRIGDSGVAPYIRGQETQNEAPAPILEDDEDPPPLATPAGSQIRIPPFLMPSNEDARKSFRDFFEHVHPYVPVLCPSHFNLQWKQDRNSISPLLLEAVFACAEQVSDCPSDGLQWLSMANRHEESFADTPRLSTIQALLLLLKAREKTPKRGYFYRSWVTVRKIVGMAKDLELHEHFDIHESGGQCGSDRIECLTKTRVWQMAMVVELMVGGPQGRSDYGVDIDTVDVSLAPPNSDLDDGEKDVSRRFAYFVRNVRNIRGMTETYHKLKRKNKDWAQDPNFLKYNEDFRRWPSDVPPEFQLSVPLRSPQSLPSHFLANMHCHYHLGIVMLYKPQLSASKDFANDDRWKMIFSLCYESAKKVCLYQEAVLEKFGTMGLACMLRGLSFPIYAILSCVMVHLIAITTPDSKHHQEAKEFFQRHMRLLERCIEEWPMPEVLNQILGLRTAFSADIDKPFSLKPTFPYGTPSERSRSPELRRLSENPHPNVANPQQHEPQYYQQPLQHNSYFPTSTMSARPAGNAQSGQRDHEYNEDQLTHQYHQLPPTSNPTNAMALTEQWNPTPIIDQFATAFAIPQSALAPPPTSSYGSSPPIALPQQNFHAHMQNQQYGPRAASGAGYNSHHYTPSPTSQSMTITQPFPSPHSHNLAQPRTTPKPYGPQQSMNSYFDATFTQAPNASHLSSRQNYGGTTISGNFDASTDGAGIDGPVYVTPREWQQSVASVYDPNGLKRKWGQEQQLGMPLPGTHSGHYGRIG